MENVVIGRRVDLAAAREWVRESLLGGSALAHHAASLLDMPAVADVMVGPEVSDLLNFAGGRRWPQRESRELLRELLSRDYSDRAAVILVEDELARKGESRKIEPVAYIGRRVVTWKYLDESAEESVLAIAINSSGNPLNAFVCTPRIVELGVHHGADISSGTLDAIVHEISAIIVSVYDAESFLVYRIIDANRSGGAAVQ